jgi:hypothetical protein
MNFFNNNGKQNRKQGSVVAAKDITQPIFNTKQKKHDIYTDGAQM